MSLLVAHRCHVILPWLCAQDLEEWTPDVPRARTIDPSEGVRVGIHDLVGADTDEGACSGG